MKKYTPKSLTAFYLIAQMTICALFLQFTPMHSSQCTLCSTECQTSTFTNNDGIFLPGPFSVDRPGEPNPSCIQVCGLPKWSIVKGLKVRLENLLYGQANLVNVILLSPCGDAVVLLNSLALNNNAVQYGNITTEEGATFIFSDCEGTSLDCNRDTDFLGTFTARPTDCAPGDYCVTNLSHRSIGTKLSATFGSLACGCWKLFTCIKENPSNGDFGSIESWSLIIDHCVPCQKPINCTVCNSCDGCPTPSTTHSSSTSVSSCSSFCSSCH